VIVFVNYNTALRLLFIFSVDFNLVLFRIEIAIYYVFSLK